MTDNRVTRWNNEKMDPLKIKHFGKYEIGVLTFLAFYLVALLFISRLHELGGYGVETDFYGSYAVQAKYLLEGKGYEDPFHGPGYSLVLALSSLAFHDIFTAGKFISIVSTLLFGLFTYKVLKSLFNARAAFFTFVILLVNILPFSLIVGTDMFFAFIVTLAVYFIFRGDRFTYLNILAGGLLAGYAFLTRYDAIFLILGVAFSFFIINPENNEWTQRLKKVAVFTGAFFLIASPWLMINYIRTGNPLYNLSYLNIAANFYNIDGVTPTEALKEASTKFDSLPAVILYDPIRFGLSYLKNAYQHFNNVIFMVLRFPLYLLLVPGAVLFVKHANRRQLSYFTFLIFGFLLLSLAIFLNRYYLPFLPFLIVLSIYFIFFYEENFEKKGLPFKVRRLFSFSGISFLLILLFLTRGSIIKTKKFVSSEPIELSSVAEFLSKEATANDILIARKPHLGYLSKVRTIWFPEANSIEELLDYAKNNHATYLLYSNIEAELRPNLKVLFEPEKVPGSLKAVYERDNPKIILYKITQNH